VVVNIEKEYSDYISNGWEKLSYITRDVFKLHEDSQRTYDAISLLSMEFLQDKLRSLEIPENSLP
jgi:hypothetical protein